MKVTAGIVCKNHGNYIKEAVQSLMLQSEKPSEIILIDDHSTDRSLHNMKQLQKSYKDTILVQRHRSSGHIDGYNQLISSASHPIFHLMAADDLLLYKYFYERCLEHLEDRSVGFVFGGLQWMDPDGRPISMTIYPPKEGVRPSLKWLEMMHKFGNYICGGAVLIRTNLQKRNLYDQSFPFSADHKNWILALRNCHKAAAIQTAVYGYRRHGGQMTFTRNAPMDERIKIDHLLNQTIHYVQNSRRRHLHPVS